MKLIYQILFFALFPLFIVFGYNYSQLTHIENVLHQKLNNEIEAVSKNILNELEQKVLTTQQLSKLLSKDQLIIDAVNSRDVNFLYERSNNFLKTKIISNIIFVDQNGLIISRGDNEFKFNDSIINTQLSIVLSDDSYSTLIYFDNNYQCITFSPIYLYDVDLVGYVVVTQNIDRKLLNQLSKERYFLEFMIEKNSVNNFTDYFKKDIAKYTHFEFIPNIGSPEMNLEKKINLYINIEDKQKEISDFKKNQNIIIFILLILSIIFIIVFTKRILAPFYKIKHNLQDFYNHNIQLDKLIENIKSIPNTQNEFLELKESILSTLESLQSSQNKLIKSSEKISHAYKLKDQFLTNMSSEIKTPINNAISFVNYLQQEEFTMKQSSHLDNIFTSLINLREVINNILDISNIESGQLVINKKFTNVQNIADSLEETYKAKIEKQKINFFINTDKKLEKYKFNIDGFRINQVIENIIDNAIKFTNGGFIRLKIKVKNMSDSFATLVFTISDSGIGIPESKQHIIFESFTQVFDKSEFKRNYLGSGLGLSVSKHIVDLMSGSITVESEKDKGSTFTITIPNIKYK